MERFFTQHNVMKDRDPDELCGRACSDSEARCARFSSLLPHMDTTSTAEPHSPMHASASLSLSLVLCV